MSKLVQFTGMNFSDLNPNSYDNLNSIKLDLNVSTKVKFNANDQGLEFKNQGNYRLNETFCTKAMGNSSTMTLPFPIYSKFYQMLDQL